MRAMGLKGVVRGKEVRTTIADQATPCPADRVNRQFRAARPNVLWLSDFTYVATWQGFAYVAFVIDAFARRIVGWRCRAQRRRVLSSTPWSRPCTTAVPCRATASSTIAIVRVRWPAVPGRPDPHSDRPSRMAGAARCLGVA
jgi:transposase InsO family protein